MWGTWTTTTLSGAIVLLLVIGLLFSFAPVILGALVALLIAGLCVGLLVGRGARGEATEQTTPESPPERPSGPERIQRAPSREAMRAEPTPGKHS
jgi:hypothetical protein